MAIIIREVITRALAAVLFTHGCATIFTSLLNFGEGRFQSTIVLSFYVYCILVLFSSSCERLFHVLSIPVLTQFLHLFQKYSFTAGANSFWRLLPFLILDLFFMDFILRKHALCPRPEQLLLWSWTISNFFFLAISPGLPAIVYGASILILITIPLYCRYLSIVSKEFDFQCNMEKCLVMMFMILALGTFGLVMAGAHYKGSDNLLATRNISDTNVTMAYFILLWPFVLLFARTKAYSFCITMVGCLIFAGIVLVSFSRGAVLIVGPLIIASICYSRHRPYWLALIIIGILLIEYAPGMTSFVDSDLRYFWKLRFGDLHSMASVSRKLQELSGRTEIHAIAYTLFLQSPLVGHGTGSFEVLGPGYREAHSMLYTFLAEQGLSGSIYIYAVFFVLARYLVKVALLSARYMVLLLALVAYLVFVHSVGTVFFIIPAKSITINCIAPVLLLCTYFYALSVLQTEKDNNA